MALPNATAAAILRAAQKDDYFIGRLASSCNEALSLFDRKIWHKYVGHIPFAANLAYYSLTTLRDFQTLGEEYTGIVQVDNTYIRIPSKLLQTLCILLATFGERIFRKILVLLKKDISNNPNLIPSAKRTFFKLISVILWAIPVLKELHTAYFFLGGYHYHMSKRFTSINYVNAVPGRRPWLGALKPLGIPYLMKSILSAFNSPPNFEDVEIEEERKNPSTSASYTSCPGCLEGNSKPCALPCGHILCYVCSKSTTSCMLCRAPYLPHRTVPLQNYTLKI